MGVIYFGSTDVSMQEALDSMTEEGIAIDAMRIRSFPFNLEVLEFIEEHDLLFIVEQNRDGQMHEQPLFHDALAGKMFVDQTFSFREFLNLVEVHGLIRTQIPSNTI